MHINLTLRLNQRFLRCLNHATDNNHTSIPFSIPYGFVVSYYFSPAIA